MLTRKSLDWKGSQEFIWSSLTLSKINTRFWAGCSWQQLCKSVFPSCILCLTSHLSKEVTSIFSVSVRRVLVRPLKAFLPQGRQAQFPQSCAVMCFSSWQSSRPSDVFDPVYQQYFSARLVVDRVFLSRDWQVLSEGEESFPSMARLLLIQPSLLLLFIVTSKHWGLRLSSGHLNPKLLVIQPVSPQPVMQNLVLIKFHWVLPACAWRSLGGSPALEQVTCITHLAMGKLRKSPLCVMGTDVKQGMSQGTLLIMSHRAQINNPFPLNMLQFFTCLAVHLSRQDAPACI